KVLDWEKVSGEDVPDNTYFKKYFLDVTSFACPKEVTKERAPREKPFSTVTARFSGMCELTSLRLARTAPILFPKNACDRGAFQRG
ncbi:hypothetical protein LLG96_18320, partial [bacterium]|nr:hypothetical protein [bacterium]